MNKITTLIKSTALAVLLINTANVFCADAAAKADYDAWNSNKSRDKAVKFMSDWGISVNDFASGKKPTKVKAGIGGGATPAKPDLNRIDYANLLISTRARLTAAEAQAGIAAIDTLMARLGDYSDTSAAAARTTLAAERTALQKIANAPAPAPGPDAAQKRAKEIMAMQEYRDAKAAFQQVKLTIQAEPNGREIFNIVELDLEN